MTKQEFLDLIVGLQSFNASLQVHRFIACQFALESFFGMSHLYAENINACGMRCVNNRINTQRKQDSGADLNKSNFASYDNLRDCVLDYALWLAYNRASSKVMFNLDAFKEFLVKHHYCPDDSYIDRINSIYLQYYG